MVNKKTIGYIIGFILIFSISIFMYQSYHYENFRGTYAGYDLQNGFGYNIFFSDRDQVLFLHGEDYRLTELLENHLVKGKVYTFYTWKEVTGCDTDCGCTTWYNYIEIRDAFGTRIHGQYGWDFT